MNFFKKMDCFILFTCGLVVGLNVASIYNTSEYDGNWFKIAVFLLIALWSSYDLLKARNA